MLFIIVIVVSMAVLTYRALAVSSIAHVAWIARQALWASWAVAVLRAKRWTAIRAASPNLPIAIGSF